MAVWILSESEKNQLAIAHTMGFHTYEQLAAEFSCSTSTVRNVLKERGLLKTKPQLSASQSELLSLAQYHHINATKLHSMINEPAMSFPNVVEYVKQLDQAHLIHLFSKTSLGALLTKVTELVNEPNQSTA